jgi:hypothetical protein
MYTSELSDPLVVSPRDAFRMLAVSHSRGYELLNKGELESYLDGRRSRKITMQSIRAYIARKLGDDERKTNPAAVAHEAAAL